MWKRQKVLCLDHSLLLDQNDTSLLQLLSHDTLILKCCFTLHEYQQDKYLITRLHFFHISGLQHEITVIILSQKCRIISPLTSYRKHSHETSLLLIYASVSDFCCMTMWQYTRSKSICFWIWHWGEIPVYSLRLEVCLFSVTWPRAHKIEKQSLTKEDHSVWVTRLPGPISKSILTVGTQRNVNKGNDVHENRQVIHVGYPSQQFHNQLQVWKKLCKT